MAIACGKDTTSSSTPNGPTMTTGGFPNGGGESFSGGRTSTGGSPSFGGTGGNRTTPVDGGHRDAGKVRDGGRGPVDEDAGSVNCSSQGRRAFPTFDRTCSTDEDCALVTHSSDCCGGIALMGISAGEKERFLADEGRCDSQIPLCACASDSAFLDDGTVLQSTTGNWAGVTAVCDANQCESRYTGKLFQCGSDTCREGQICEHDMGGTHATPVLFCEDDPGCAQGCSHCPSGCPGCVENDAGNVSIYCSE